MPYPCDRCSILGLRVLASSLGGKSDHLRGKGFDETAEVDKRLVAEA